jgi:hypothetical protein
MTKKASEFVNDLKQALTSFRIELLLPEDERNKLESLKDSDRDVTELSSITLDRMAAAFMQSLETASNLVDDTTLAATSCVEAAGYAYRDDVADRIKTGRKDLALRPLSREYVKRKGNARIGYLGGALYRSIANCEVRVAKRGSNS